jgi:hypothetical protein
LNNGGGYILTIDLVAELAGAFAVYLTTERAKYLNGKYASVNWDVEELEARSEDIVSKALLTEELKGVFSSVD